MAFLILLGVALCLVSCQAGTLTRTVNEDHDINLCAAFYEIHQIEGNQTENICDHRNPQYYVACCFHGEFSAEVKHCGEGLVFNVAAENDTDICVEAVDEELMECPSWIDVANSADAMDMVEQPVISPFAIEHLAEGTHGCIDCTIDPCHVCLCNEGLRASTDGISYKPDPYSAMGERFLVCHYDSITCHPCPEGLVWDCVHNTCGRPDEASCPDIPEPCMCACGRSKPSKTVTTVVTATVTTVTTTTTTVTATTSTLHPSGAVVPSPGTTFEKQYTIETTSVCTTTTVEGVDVDMPCKDILEPISTTSAETATTTDFKSLVSPMSNTTTITTSDTCSGTTTSTSTTACPDACPSVATTIAVSPCVSDLPPV